MFDNRILIVAIYDLFGTAREFQVSFRSDLRNCARAFSRVRGARDLRAFLLKESFWKNPEFSRKSLCFSESLNLNFLCPEMFLFFDKDTFY